MRVADVARVEDGAGGGRDRWPSATASAAWCSRCASSPAPTPSRWSTRSASALDEHRSRCCRRATAGGRARQLRDHPHQRRRGQGAPDPRRALRRAGRAALPGQPAQHHHRGARHPDLDHRHLRADVDRRASPSTPSPCWRWRWRSASSSTTPSSCSRTSSASSTRRGCSPAQAAILATKEIGLAVLATTLSLIAVFLPVAFMGGIVGRFLQSFGLTMAFAIAVSLFVSFTLTPMLAARWLKAARPVATGGGRPQEADPRAHRRRVLPADRARLHARCWAG